jgi:hypothetical protein
VRRLGTTTNPSAIPEASPTFREVMNVFEAQVARHPLGAVLDVRPVQRFELEPPGEEQQQPAPAAQHRAGTDPGAFLEDRAEHREVHRDPLDAEPGSGRHQLGDHVLDQPVVAGPVAAHQVE